MFVHNCMDTEVVSFTGSKVTRSWENGKIGKWEGSVCSDWDVALEILVEALIIAQGTSAAEAHEFLIRLVISSSSFDSFIFHNNIILRVSVIFHEDCTGDQELKRWHKAILVSWMRGKLLLSSVRIFLEWFEQRKKCKLFSDKETRSQVRVLLKWNSPNQQVYWGHKQESGCGVTTAARMTQWQSHHLTSHPSLHES